MTRDPYPSERAERFIVRLPEGMRERIAKAAEANNRSMNAEIVSRLQSSFDDPINIQHPDSRELVNVLLRLVEEKIGRENPAGLRRLKGAQAKKTGS